MAVGEMSAHRDGRGRDAMRPGEIPARGWVDVAVRVRTALGAHRVSLLAAGVALFGLLAAFPALAAIVSIYGLFASPADVAGHLQSLSGVIPADALEIVRNQLSDVASQQSTALGFGVALSLLVALWSTRKGIVALMMACNAAYGETERRGFFTKIGVSMGLTFGAIVYFIVALTIGAAVPLAAEALFQNDILVSLANAVRWVLLWLFVVFGLAVIYRYAPSRTRARWRWVSWGSAMAATLWIAGSLLFELYVRNFGSYGETYGALAGAVVLLLWLYLSAFFVILGAEINAELEHQTERDSTIGPEAPLGERGAYVADTVGEARR